MRSKVVPLYKTTPFVITSTLPPTLTPQPPSAPSDEYTRQSSATARAADNFQITGDDPVELCRVEAWMATNCPLDKVFLEIYENDCDCPANKIYTIDLADDLDGDGVVNGVDLGLLLASWSE